MNNIDQNIIKHIENKNSIAESYWDFKDNNSKNSIYYTHSYPAKMVPGMQEELINIILDNDATITNILDPYMGSGTIITEGLCRNLKPIGIDINPFAYLITLVHSTKLSIKLLKEKYALLKERISSISKIEPFYFNGINKWYNPEIIDQLSIIRHNIMKEDSIEYRRFFWLSFSEIVRLSNNSQKSTFKLHIKKKEVIDNFKYDCIKNFYKQVEDDIKIFEEFYNSFSFRKNSAKLYLGDSIKTLQNKKYFKNSSIDLIVTSPPYGDNHTTVTYGQFSILPLRWINILDIDENIDTSILNTLTQIDSKSLGGKYYSIDEIRKSELLEKSKTLNETFQKLVKNNEYLKARKVSSFYIDFYKSCIELARILKEEHYAIFTIGNRRVNGEVVRFDLILTELLETLDLEYIYQFDRNIPSKRIPSKISRLKNNKPVYSIQTELTLIFKKLSN